MLYRVNEKWNDGKICDRINNDLWIYVCHAAEQILMIVEIYNHDEFDYIYCFYMYFFFFNKSLYNEGNIKKKSSFDELSIINYYFWNNLKIDWNFERD